MIGKKIIAKRKCKACGNSVMIKLNSHGPTYAPDNCSMCRTLGVEKAIEQRLSVKLKCKNTKIKIESKKELSDLIRYRKQK
jgi:ssDNA-binding Zn-finger/Zn-ribbon topoisomerase 1